MSMSNTKGLLTPRQVAELLQVRPRTVTRWCREGVFPTAHRVGRAWRLRYDDQALHLMVYKEFDANH